MRRGCQSDFRPMASGRRAWHRNAQLAGRQVGTEAGKVKPEGQEEKG